MGLKKYVIASFLLMAVVSLYVYSINQHDFTLNIPELGISQTLPLYIWIVVPAFVLFVATVLHILFYGAKGYFQRNTIQKDLEKISMALQERLLKKKSNITFKTEELKEFNNIINQIDFNLVSNGIDTQIKEIQKSVETINKLNNNEYIPMKELKLSEENPFYKKNILNRVLNDDNFAIEVLKSASNYDEDIIKIAFDRALENKSIATIKKAIEGVTLSSEMVKNLLIKDSKSPKDMSFANSEILELIQDNKFSNTNLMEVAKNYKRTMSPEQLIKLFEDIAANDESLTPSYLYVLFEYEMIEQAREVIVNSQKDEYVVFKAMLDLRDAGKHYSLDALIFN